MSHNTANSQRPSRADSSRKQAPGDSDRRTLSPAGPAVSLDRGGVQHPTRHVASPPPGTYVNFSSGYQSMQPSLNAHPHQQHHYHQPGPQASAAYPTYGGAPGHVEGYGYGGPQYHPGRHNVDVHHYARPSSRTQSQSSGSGSAPSPHDAVPGSHYTSHFSGPFPTVSSNPSVGQGARTRWAWVPVEVPQTHMPDDAHLQYAPYPGAYYPSPPASSTPTTSAPHQSYQPSYGEGSLPATPSYGVQASPSYNPSYPYHMHSGHYGPPSSHNTNAHGVASGRSPWTGPAHGGTHPSGAARDVMSGGGGRRQSNQSARSGGSNARRTSSHSSGQVPSPHRSSGSLPQRPAATPHESQDVTSGVSASSTQPLDLVGEEDTHDQATRNMSESALDVDADTEGGASSEITSAERVPGSGLRPHYHPQQGPRSDFVLWCGNVPQDATVEELWEAFSRLTPDEYRNWIASPEGQEQGGELAEPDVEGHGVLSIFIISRSNCAFINYASPAHLDRAVKYYHGKQVRPHDPRCPKLVCRVRKKDDEAQAGVAGQRGRGIHVAWLRQQRELERSQTVTSSEPNPDATLSDAVTSSEPLSPTAKESSAVAAGLASAGSYSSSGSTSYASTNSSLFRHPAFRQRFFILKSLRTDDLDRSIETGYWATQPHNENVLDQAYRNSETVYLIFGVNQTGQFYGYAKMAGPIHTHTADGKSKDEQRRRTSLSSVLSTASGSLPPATIPESADESASESGPALSGISSPSDFSVKRSHPTLDKRDIDVARGLFGTLSVDGAGETSNILPMTSPLPLSPYMEEAGFDHSLSPRRNDTITQRTAGSMAQSSTWPYTSMKASTADPDSEERPKLASALSEESSVPRMTAEPDEFGVRRIDMETESSQTVSSQSDRDQPSLAPSDSASWSSADPRMAEQIALRAVIHNLRLDELESRAKPRCLRISFDLRPTTPTLRSPRKDPIQVHKKVHKKGTSELRHANRPLIRGASLSASSGSAPTRFLSKESRSCEIRGATIDKSKCLAMARNWNLALDDSCWRSGTSCTRLRR